MESKGRHIQKRIGQLCWISAEKSVLKGLTLLGHEDFARCSNTCEVDRQMFDMFLVVDTKIIGLLYIVLQRIYF